MPTPPSPVTGEAARSAELARRFGLDPERLRECLRIHRLGSASADRTLAEPEADLLETMKGKPLSEILVGRGYLSADRREEFERALVEFPIVSNACEADEVGRAAHAGAPERRFGRYHLRGELGRGGMGIVYLAHDPDLGRDVALKVLLAGEAAGEDLVRRFVREARAAARISHPNVAAVYDVGEHEGKPFLTMEVVPGGSLADRLERNDRPALRTAVDIVVQVADGLACAHEHGVVHRDLKPENVLFDASGRAKVADFGLARMVTEEGSQRTVTGVVLGTPAYMAPEQALGDLRNVDERSDVYSLACVLYRAVTGRTPYPPGPPMEVVLRKIAEEPPAARTVQPSIPPDLDAVLGKAMERERKRRYASVHEFRDDLKRWFDGEPVQARPVGTVGRWWRRAARRPGTYGAAALAAIAIVAGWASTWSLSAKSATASKERVAAHGALIDQLRAAALVALDAAEEMRRRGESARPRDLVKKFEEAVARARREIPTSPEPPYLLGRLERILHAPERALELQEEALALDPTFVPARYERAILTIGAFEGRSHARREAHPGIGSLSELLASAGVEGFDPTPAERSDGQPAAPAASDPTEDAWLEQLRSDLKAALSWGEPGRGAPVPAVQAARACARAYGERFSRPARTGAARDGFEAALRHFSGCVDAHDALVRIEWESGDLAAAESACTRGIATDGGAIPLWAARAAIRRRRAERPDATPAEALNALRGAEEDLARVRDLTRAFGDGWTAAGLGAPPGDWSRETRADPQRLLLHLAVLRCDLLLARASRLEAAGQSATAVLAELERERNQAFPIGGTGDPGGRERLDLALAFAREALRRGTDARAAIDRAWDVATNLRGTTQPTDALLRAVLATLRWQLQDRHGSDPGYVVKYATSAAEDPRHAAAAHALAGVVWLRHAEALEHSCLVPTPALARAIAAFTEALAARRRARRTLLHRAEACLRQAAFARRRGEPSAEAAGRAREDAAAVLAAAPDDAEALGLRARALAAMAAAESAAGGDSPAWGQAMEDASRALKTRATEDLREFRAGFALEWARVQIRAGNSPSNLLRAAIEDANALLRDSSDHPEALRTRGEATMEWALLQQARGEDPTAFFEQAIADLRAAGEANAQAAHPWTVLGRLYESYARLPGLADPRRQELHAAALDACGRALAIHPLLAETLRRRARLHHAGQQWREASRDFQAAAAIDPAGAAADAALAETSDLRAGPEAGDESAWRRPAQKGLSALRDSRPEEAAQAFQHAKNAWEQHHGFPSKPARPGTPAAGPAAREAMARVYFLLARLHARRAGVAASAPPLTNDSGRDGSRLVFACLHRAVALGLRDPEAFVACADFDAVRAEWGMYALFDPKRNAAATAGERNK